MEKTFGFIGVGNMGGALARAACRGIGGARVLVSDALAEKAAALAEACGCTAVRPAEIAAVLVRRSTPAFRIRRRRIGCR